LIAPHPGIYEWARILIGRGGPLLSALPADEAAQILGAKNIIILDPQAEKPLSREEVLHADAFIVGGIVDRTPRPGETKRIRLLGVAKPRKILFHGDIHGVPNRINAIIEILLKARYRYCGNIDEAIRSTMSRRDVILRAMVELSRWSRGKKRRVPITLYEELRKWLPITLRDFIIAARKIGLEVEGFSKGQTLHENPR
jgi:tRNA (adenine9-N1/guanine9-N1)-methyltransferase